MAKVWFYDNDYHNKPSKNRLEIVFKKVRDSPPPKGALKAMSRWGGLDAHYPKITYSKTEAYDKASGITKSQCDELIDAVKNGLVLCVVFDWDRTLSKTEGLYGSSATGQYPAFPGNKSVTEYRVGLGEGFQNLNDYEFVSYFFNELHDYTEKKESRAAMIGNLLNFLHDNNIPIFVLTNSRIGVHSPGIMSKMLNVLAPNKIISKNNILFNHERNKELAIRNRIYNHSSVKGIITKEMIRQWDATATAYAAARQVARRNDDKKKSSKTLGKNISGKSRSQKKRSCPGPNCNIMGGRRKTRKIKKKRKTKRRRKRKSSKTRKLNV